MPDSGGLSLRAPAKINLSLRVRGRRPDGYHELESLLLPLDLADDVDVAWAPGPPLGVALDLVEGCPAAPPAAENLAVRAAEAFLSAARPPLGGRVRIRLRKRIPIAAGLGGGSSDAGAVLRALAALFPDAIEPPDLAALALGLGADVPYFLDPRPARVSGVGERIAPEPGVPSLTLLLVNPGLPLSTAEVFAAHDALGAGGDAPPAAAGPGLEGLLRAVANDLEPAAVRLCPPVARLRAALRASGAQAVGMSGSGPTLFGVFPERAAAEAARAQAAFGPPVWARVATTVQSQ